MKGYIYSNELTTKQVNYLFIFILKFIGMQFTSSHLIHGGETFNTSFHESSVAYAITLDYTYIMKGNNPSAVSIHSPAMLL